MYFARIARALTISDDASTKMSSGTCKTDNVNRCNDKSHRSSCDRRYIVTYDSVSHFKKGEFAQVDYPSV